MPSAGTWETYGTHATNAHANYRPSRSNPGTLSITINTRIEAYIMATGTSNGTPHKSHVSSRDYSNAKAHNRRPRQLKSSLTNQMSQGTGPAAPGPTYLANLAAETPLAMACQC